MAEGCSYLHSLIWTPLNSGSTLVWGSKSRMWNTERLLLIYPVEQLWERTRLSVDCTSLFWGSRTHPGLSTFTKLGGNGGLRGFCPV